MDEYREAVCVHLHDQRVIITADIFTDATDSQFTSNEPEYLLSSDLAKALMTQVLGVLPSEVPEVGLSRGYAEFPSDNCKLERLEVRIVSDRIVDLRMTLAIKKGDKWIEEWTYSGSFTVKWALVAV